MDDATPVDSESIDYVRIRRRFPWVGLVDTGDRDLAAGYREIMAEARPSPDREQSR